MTPVQKYILDRGGAAILPRSEFHHFTVARAYKRGEIRTDRTPSRGARGVITFPPDTVFQVAEGY